MNYRSVLLIGLTLCSSSASVISQPAYMAGAPPAIGTAYSHQVVARNYNRVYVSTSGGYLPCYVHVPYATTYATASGVIPYYSAVYTNNRYGYTYPLYGLSYGYGSTYR